MVLLNTVFSKRFDYLFENVFETVKKDSGIYECVRKTIAIQEVN